MTDFAALSIAPTDSAGKKPPKPKRAGRVYKPRCSLEERRAKAIANGMAGLRLAWAKRGVTRWHKIAMAMPEGEWLLSRDVWARLPGERGLARQAVAAVLVKMAVAGDVERKPLPGRAPAGLYRVEMPDGRVFFSASPQWLYRITPKGLEKAEEGRQRQAAADAAPKPSKAAQASREAT